MNTANFKTYLSRIFIVVTGFLASPMVQAAAGIAVLDFELNDITSLPNTPAELTRTASFRPLLEQALTDNGAYKIISIDTQAKNRENAGFGYLFKFEDVAAKLGKQFAADWVIVSQHSKPSFLYSHLMVHLIKVGTQTLAASYDIELKGNHEKVSQRGINAVAKQIHASIAAYQ
ncbi:MAG: DUF2380 domain-containing protein [Methylococcales bacterium]